MAILQVNDIYMGFSGETLFKEISFSVDEKDKIGLIGVNGAGKTTLIKLLLGLENSEINPATNEPRTAAAGRTVLFRCYWFCRRWSRNFPLRIVLPTAQHLHFVCDNIVCRALDTVFTLIFAALNPALNIHLCTFSQVLCRHLRQTTVHCDIVPLRPFDTVSCLISPLFARCQTEIAYPLAASHITELGIVSQTTYQNYLVQGHFIPSI